MSTSWPDIAADLRRAMIAAGTAAHAIDRVLAALQPVVSAVEAAGRRVELELAWALLAVVADKQRRAAIHTRLRRTA